MSQGHIFYYEKIRSLCIYSQSERKIRVEPVHPDHLIPFQIPEILPSCLRTELACCKARECSKKQGVKLYEDRKTVVLIKLAKSAFYLKKNLLMQEDIQ